MPLSFLHFTIENKEKIIKKAIFLWSIVVFIPLLIQEQNINTKTNTKRGLIKFGTGFY